MANDDYWRSDVPPPPFDPVADVEEFHRKFKVSYDGLPRLLPSELREFRERFLGEEREEYLIARLAAEVAVLSPQESLPGQDPVAIRLAEMLDALVDLVYVALGNAHLHGFNFREAWRRVHEANMLKIRAARAEDSKRGTIFDVVKPPGWVAPDHSDLVSDHAHKEKP